MLNYLFLDCFQKHKKRRVDFSPRITVLAGPSGAGKSSLLRALEWVCLNRPAGDKLFMRWGSDQVSVELGVGKHTITRKKGKGKNCYILDGKEFVFSPASRDVPAGIAKLLKVSDLNFQGQLDPPFWFCSTPGQVGKELNKIVDLEVIDHALSYLATEVRHSRYEVESSKARWRNAKDKQEELSWVPDYVEAVQKVEDLHTQYEEVSAQADFLEVELDKIAALKKPIAIPDLTELDHLSAKILALEGQEVGLQRLLGEIEKREESWQSSQRQLLQTQERLNAFTKKKCPTCGRPFPIA